MFKKLAGPAVLVLVAGCGGSATDLSGPEPTDEPTVLGTTEVTEEPTEEPPAPEDTGMTLAAWAALADRACVKASYETGGLPETSESGDVDDDMALFYGRMSYVAASASDRLGRIEAPVEVIDEVQLLVDDFAEYRDVMRQISQYFLEGPMTWPSDLEAQADQVAAEAADVSSALGATQCAALFEE